MSKFIKKPFSGEENAGFTLIELLVVVLIIGILSSVALPQYQLAVQKTRTMRLLPLLRAISDAENVYYMANGAYTLKFEDLDISMPAGGKLESDGTKIAYGDFYCYLRSDGDSPTSFSAYCNDTRNGAPTMEKYFSRKSFVCWGNTGEGSLSWRVCQSISGKKQPEYSNDVGRASFTF